MSSGGPHKSGAVCLLQERCAPGGPSTAAEEGHLEDVSVCICVGGITTFCVFVTEEQYQGSEGH